MKIAIDTSCLLINPNCGLAEVVRNLVFKLPLVEKENQFTLFYNYFKSEKQIDSYEFPGTINHILRVPRRLINWSWKVDFPHIDMFLPKTEIYHSLHVIIPPSNRLKKVLTVHDCRFLAFPELYPPQTVEDYRHLMNISLERSDMVATVSNSTRQELLKYFTISEDRIKVIYNGFNSHVSDTTNNEKRSNCSLKKIYLPKDYLLFIGVLDPRKNLQRLIEALFILKEDVKDIPDLVIAGISSKQWNKSDEKKNSR
jgi:glycosyltransferase involved in cell wall biosynthesis